MKHVKDLPEEERRKYKENQLASLKKHIDSMKDCADKITLQVFYENLLENPDRLDNDEILTDEEAAERKKLEEEAEILSDMEDERRAKYVDYSRLFYEISREERLEYWNRLLSCIGKIKDRDAREEAEAILDYLLNSDVLLDRLEVELKPIDPEDDLKSGGGPQSIN